MTLILEAGHSNKRPNNVSNFLMTQSVCLHVRIKSWNVLMCISMCPHFLKFQAFSYILENSHWHFHFLCRVGPFVGIFFLGVPLALCFHVEWDPLLAFFFLGIPLAVFYVDWDCQIEENLCQSQKSYHQTLLFLT